MRYTKPLVIRADEAILAIQSVNKRDSQKPVGPILDNAGTKQTTQNAYEADE